MLLVSDRVMGCYDLNKPVELYVDDGPNGVVATGAQPEEVPGYDHIL